MKITAILDDRSSASEGHLIAILQSSDGLKISELIKKLKERDIKTNRMSLITHLKRLQKKALVWTTSVPPDYDIVYFAAPVCVKRHDNAIAWGIEHVLDRGTKNTMGKNLYGRDTRSESEEDCAEDVG